MTQTVGLTGERVPLDLPHQVGRRLLAAMVEHLAVDSMSRPSRSLPFRSRITNRDDEASWFDRPAVEPVGHERGAELDYNSD